LDVLDWQANSYSSVAQECRRSRKRMRRTPLRAQRPTKILLTLAGSVGVPIGVVNTRPSCHFTPPATRSASWRSRWRWKSLYAWHRHGHKSRRPIRLHRPKPQHSPGSLQRLTYPKHASIKINVSPRESQRLTTRTRLSQTPFWTRGEVEGLPSLVVTAWAPCPHYVPA
jgi:hypothetical protein